MRVKSQFFPSLYLSPTRGERTNNYGNSCKLALEKEYMDFKYSPKEEAFRQEIQDWLLENSKELPEWWFDRSLKRPDLDSKEFHDFSIWWHKKLYAAGFVGISWPKEYGGRGARLLQEGGFSEES